MLTIKFKKRLGIILTFYIISCNPTNPELTKEKLFGKWKLQSVSIKFIHAVLKVKRTDKLEIPEQRVHVNFSVEFAQHNFYKFENESNKSGKFNLTDSLLTLYLNGNSKDWLVFHIDSVTTNKLYLYSEKMYFYSNAKDTIEFLTGENINLVLKKE
jgi:hypothetical protein